VHVDRKQPSVAAALWGRCFRSEECVLIEVLFDAERELASGSSKDFGELGPSNRYPGKTLMMEGAAYQIAGKGAPADPGITIGLPVNDYLTAQIWFDRDAAGRSQDVPDGRVDAVTLFLHEMGHALGFNGRLADQGATQGSNG
jgi:hypothetical protein